MTDAHPPSQAAYRGKRNVQPQLKREEPVPNRPPENLNLAKPELMPKPDDPPPQT